MRAYHESPDLIYKDLTYITKSRMFFCLLKHFEASLTNSVDPDQTAPIYRISLIWVNTVCVYTYVKQ